MANGWTQFCPDMYRKSAFDARVAIACVILLARMVLEIALYNISLQIVKEKIVLL